MSQHSIVHLLCGGHLTPKHCQDQKRTSYTKKFKYNRARLMILELHLFVTDYQKVICLGKHPEHSKNVFNRQSAAESASQYSSYITIYITNSYIMRMDCSGVECTAQHKKEICLLLEQTLSIHSQPPIALRRVCQQTLDGHPFHCSLLHGFSR